MSQPPKAVPQIDIPKVFHWHHPQVATSHALIPRRKIPRAASMILPGSTCANSVTRSIRKIQRANALQELHLVLDQ